MTYCDVIYLAIFLPITVLIYNIIPKKHRWKVLLIASYLFFWSISKKLTIFIIFSAYSIHHLGMWIENIQDERNKKLKEAEKDAKKEIKNIYLKKQRKVLLFGVLIHFGILVMFKYTGFILENINSIFSVLKINMSFNIIQRAMPIGISFYTLQAVSYIIDVYHEKIKADKNLGRLALFLTFFPQIIEGPICRYSETAMQLYEGKQVTFKNMCFGIQRIGYGLLKKIVIADRLNIFIENVFSNYAKFDGGIIALAMIMYTIELYMDFSGVIDVAIGSAEIFGIKLPENFKQPFFSKTISEFWTRWHITLGTWLRDYIFYPLSLSEPLKKLTTNARKKLGKYYGPILSSTVALFCVWIFNGLWHGAAWSFIFFGMYHFTLILFGKILEPLINNINKKLHLNKENRIYNGMQIAKTTILVLFGELFFRAQTVNDGFQMIGKMFSNLSFKYLNQESIINAGMDKYGLAVVFLFTIVVLTISIFKEKGVNIREKIAEKNIIIRWGIYYLLIFSILIFGAYGIGYIPVEPMYANF